MNFTTANERYAPSYQRARSNWHCLDNDLCISCDAMTRDAICCVYADPLNRARNRSKTFGANPTSRTSSWCLWCLQLSTFAEHMIRSRWSGDFCFVFTICTQNERMWCRRVVSESKKRNASRHFWANEWWNRAIRCQHWVSYGNGDLSNDSSLHLWKYRTQGNLNAQLALRIIGMCLPSICSGEINTRKQDENNFSKKRSLRFQIYQERAVWRVCRDKNCAHTDSHGAWQTTSWLILFATRDDASMCGGESM